KRTVSSLADDSRFLAKYRRPRYRRIDSNDFTDQAPQPLHKPPGALHAFFGPDHVAVRGRIRKHEPARGVSSGGGENIVRVDGIFLGLRLFLDRADLERLTRCCEHRASRITRAFNLHISRLDPVAVFCAVGLVHNHALGEQPGEWLVHADMSSLAHGTSEEARIEQM